MASAPETPRKRKDKESSRLPGIRKVNASVDRLGEIVASRLKLSFKPETWQATLIHKIAEGYDSIFCAGTGYGKSLIFEGLATFEKTKTFVVISPLKVLEMDQVREATSKGLTAIAINEDTMKAETDIWKRVRNEHFNLIYVSPELAVGAGSPMLHLWKDPQFSKRLGAVFVDEAHCIDEWGAKFREEYRALKQLRSFTGFEVPIVACSATMPTSTFDIIWDSLDFGHRPFWGLDVGTVRDDLFYTIRPITDPKKLLLHVLNILPASLTANTLAEAIRKTLIYFATPELCAQFVRDLRKCLPAHLRDVVRHFSAGISEKAKKQMWDHFMAGRIRVLVSTEATALGCNDKHIEYCFVFLASMDPRTLSVLMQRWGRTARARGFHGVCFFFVPLWAIRPSVLPAPDLERVKGRAKLPETKAATARRAKLHEPLEKLINIGQGSTEETCVHKYLAAHFRPATKLDEYTSLEHDVNTPPATRGTRSLSQPSLSLTWTVIDLGRRPAPGRCCYLCNAEYSATLIPLASRTDPRLSAFARDFLFPLAESAPAGRPSSHEGSQRSGSAASTQRTTSSRQAASKVTVPKEARTALHDALEAWREEYYVLEGSPCMMTPRMLCPNRVLKELADNASFFASVHVVDHVIVRSKIHWELADEDNLTSLAALLTKWRETSKIPLAAPQSGRGNRKKARTGEIARPAAGEADDDVFNPAGLLWAPNPSNHFTLPEPARAIPSRTAASPYGTYYVPGHHAPQRPQAPSPGFPVQGPGALTPQTPLHPYPIWPYTPYAYHHHPGPWTPQTPLMPLAPQNNLNPSHLTPSESPMASSSQLPGRSQILYPTYHSPPAYLAHPSYYSHPGYYLPTPGSQPLQLASQTPSSQHPLSQSHLPE